MVVSICGVDATWFQNVPLRLSAGIGNASECAGFQCNFNVPLQVPRLVIVFNDKQGLVSQFSLIFWKKGGGGGMLPLKLRIGGGAGGISKQ